ncbi:MAG: hypothetical protein MI724_18525 [Spirochaetales bacterium]|nr:hypothetical protein [Spirochaetales bacterium]
MTKKDVIDAYFSLMKEDMAKYGFKQRKSDLEFVRKTDFGFLRVVLQIIHYSQLQESLIHFLLQVRRDDVQELVNKALGIFPKGHATSTTTNTHFQVIMGRDDFRYTVRNETDLADSVRHFMDFFGTHGISHLEKYSALENLAGIYEEHGPKANAYFGPFGWYKYVAIVRYLHDSDSFEDFIAHFYEQLPSYGVNEDRIDELKEFVSAELRSF